MAGWLKAGLIGGAVLAVFQLIGLVPFNFICCLTIPGMLITYLAVGALAAAWMAPPRVAGRGAGQGALGAMLAAVISSVVGMIVNMIRVLITPQEAVIMDLPPEIMQQLQATGLPLELFVGVGGVVIFYGFCCLGWVFFSALLGAIGGAIYPSVKPE
ncbi:MAG: hypothetical protein AB1894_21205 [Chloroflexota bacterium]